MGSVFSTVRLQGPSSGVLDIWPTSLYWLRQSRCADNEMMVLPWSQHPQTGDQRVFSEPEADLVFPGAERAGGSGWKAACAHMRAEKLLLLALVLHF